jgi:hypothetical protein
LAIFRKTYKIDKVIAAPGGWPNKIRKFMEYKVGMIITHPNKPEWGPGKIQAVNGKDIVVYFRDLCEQKPGDAQKTISTDWAKLTMSEVQSEPWLDNLPPYKAGQSFPPKIRVTMKQGIESFLSKYPSGFENHQYFAEEREYKLKAHHLYDELLGNGQFSQLLSSNNIDELVKRVLAVESRINVLSVFEKVAFRDALKNKDSGTAYMQTLLDVLEKGSQENVLTAHFEAVTNLPAELGKSRVATWPVATVMPYLARPDVFMFLKPDVTKECAERLNFNLCYDAKPNWLTYSKLLLMCDLLMEQLESLGAKDMIDLQSFIWVIGRY